MIVVCDNASSDATATAASEAGAVVISEPRRGKGYAVRRLFSIVEADVFVLVDGDGTYDVSAAPAMVKRLLDERLDLLIGVRVGQTGTGDEMRRGHRFGNRFLTWTFQILFRLEIKDTLSGYRVMSRRFVKTFPSGSAGFEVETDINVHASALGIPMGEHPTAYAQRAQGSASKLNTFRDGWRILRRNLRLFRDARPALAFFLLGLPWLLASAALMAYVFDFYFSTGLVKNFPSLIAGVGCFLVFLNLWISGLVLARISRNRDEVVRLAYLGQSGPLRASGAKASEAPSTTSPQ
jgi:glycosyltransferase involved in cell wall biosynthesis